MLERLCCLDESEVGQRRLEIIEMYDKCGEEVRRRACGADREVIRSRRKKRLKEAEGRVSRLVPYSTIRDRLRRSEIDGRIVEKIMEIRQEHPKLGKK